MRTTLARRLVQSAVASSARRKLAFAFVFALMVAALPVGLPLFGTRTAQAATFRNLVAQVPPNPTDGQSVRIWMNSDTAFGETAGVEYQIGNTFTKVLGTFDTSFPGANWRADIPGQPAGTTVQYQLFTRNEVGQDYGFTGFNWSYTVAPANNAPVA
ncbi:MAG TPA: hypothetical protein VJT82_00405, partial [Pyrinomonadaceae bacterium]|nr:hypothetical protein [Pyrinomonadaceae bacterium]